MKKCRRLVALEQWLAVWYAVHIDIDLVTPERRKRLIAAHYD